MLYLIFKDGKLTASCRYHNIIYQQLEKIEKLWKENTDIVISNLEVLGWLSKEFGKFKQWRECGEIFWVMNFWDSRVKAHKLSPMLSIIISKKHIFDMQKLSFIFLKREDDYEDFKEMSRDLSKIKEYIEENKLKLKLHRVCSPASIAKNIYYSIYPETIKPFSRYDALFKQTYIGGLVLSYYRGWAKDIIDVDYSRLYATIQREMRIESYRKFSLKKVALVDFKRPQIMSIKTNFGYTQKLDGFLITYFKEPTVRMIWNYDLKTFARLIPDFKYEIQWICNVVPEAKYEGAVDKCLKLKGHLGKLTANSLYGCYAQVKPFKTRVTNFAIAGMITARARMKLTELVEFFREKGLKVYYTDTDSIMTDKKGLAFINQFNQKSDYKIVVKNTADTAWFLSAKKYILLGDNPKASLFGKWLFNIEEDFLTSIADYLYETGEKEMPFFDKNLEIKIIKTSRFVKGKYPFHRQVILKPMLEQFLKSYFRHIDVKLTPEKGWRSFKKIAGRSYITKKIENDFRSAINISDVDSAQRQLLTSSKKVL